MIENFSRSQQTNYCLLFFSSADKTVKVWNLEKQECVKTFKEHTDQVWSCKFNGDGTRLVSGGEDGTLVIYGYD